MIQLKEKSVVWKKGDPYSYFFLNISKDAYLFGTLWHNNRALLKKSTYDDMSGKYYVSTAWEGREDNKGASHFQLLDFGIDIEIPEDKYEYIGELGDIVEIVNGKKQAEGQLFVSYKDGKQKVFGSKALKIGEDTVFFLEDAIKVGCQVISREMIKEILEKLDKEK